MAYSQDSYSKVWVGGLLSTLRTAELRRVFSRCGDVTRCKIWRSIHSGVGGYAFIDFTDEEGAERAVEELDGAEMHGKVITVHREHDTRPEYTKPRILVSKVPVKPLNTVQETVLKISRMNCVCGPYTILWHSLAECQVLFKVDLKQTAVARKMDTMKTLIAKGALNEDLAKTFVEDCQKSLEEQCRREGVPWEVTMCEWSEEEEKRMETRSTFIECLQSFTPLWATWKDFKASYGSEVTEDMIREVCGGLIDVVKDSSPSKHAQAIGETESRIIELIDTRQDCEQRIAVMLFGLPGKQITLDRFTQAYEKSCGHKLSDYFGHAKLLRLLEDMPDLLEVTGSGPKRLVKLQPLRVFALELTELLNDAPGTCLHICHVVPAYNKAHHIDFNATHYGYMKLIQVLEAIPDTVWSEGVDASRMIHLKKTSGKDRLSLFSSTYPPSASSSSSSTAAFELASRSHFADEIMTILMESQGSKKSMTTVTKMFNAAFVVPEGHPSVPAATLAEAIGMLQQLKVVVFSELNPFANIDLQQARSETIDKRIVHLLLHTYAGTGSKARLLDILHDYWQSHGPLPLSRVQGQGTTLYSFLCGNPAISFTGTKASEIYIAVKSSETTVDQLVHRRKPLVSSIAQTRVGSEPSVSPVPGATPSRQSLPKHTCMQPQMEKRHFDYREMSKKTLKLSDIQKPLTREMYREKFHKLLFWEENEHETILKERCNGKYTFVVLAINDKPHRIHPQSQHKRYGYLTGITGNNVENATQSSQGVKLIIEKGAKIFCEGTGECIQIQQSITTKADILRENLFHTEDRLYLALEDIHMLVDLEIGLHESCNIPVCVEFENKLIQFESLHQSIEKLPPLQAQRIFPDECHFPKPTCTITGPLLADSCRLSDDQELALRAMLSAPSHGPPFLLSGPFGTGKTYILAAAAHCFFKQGREDHSFVRIFVGTQQHVAAQKFLECFVDIMLPHDDIDIARVVPDSYHMKSSDMKEYTWTASDFRSSLASFKRQHLCLVIATCMTSMQLGRLLPGSFTHLLLDEGANLREPEGIIPLQLADPNTKIVIAGDHHQVGPSLRVLSSEAHSNGLSKSLYERLQEHYTRLGDSAEGYRMMLVSNYRCHAGILRLVERLFYDTELICRVHHGSAHPDAPFPLKFICSSVDDAVCYVESSNNEREAMIVLQEAKKFCVAWPEHTWGKRDFSQICAISSTRSQLAIFNKLLSQRQIFDDKMKKIDKIPTYDIQGREFRAVFLSTSEPTVMLDGGRVSPSNPTKSISDRFVFNTVVTRSRSLVVAVGNPFLLLKIEQHMVQRYGKMGKCWSHYLDACIRNRSLSIDPDVAAPQGCLEKIEEYVQRSLAAQC